MTREAVRGLLNRDTVWAVFALADLAPESFRHCTWWQLNAALGLLYRGFSTPILWADGVVDLPFDEPALILQLRPELVQIVRGRYRRVTLRKMLRMALQGTPSASPGHRLGPAHLPALQLLYDAPDGPNFLHSAMLDHNVFFGAWQDEQLIAAAGTHVVNIEESVAAIGYVYTHPAHRNRGHATRLTAAVVCELRRLGIETIALSVVANNHAAITTYTRLGFRAHCDFYEGFATDATRYTRLRDPF